MVSKCLVLPVLTYFLVPRYLKKSKSVILPFSFGKYALSRVGKHLNAFHYVSKGRHKDHRIYISLVEKYNGRARDELYEILLCEATVGQQGIEFAINL